MSYTNPDYLLEPESLQPLIDDPSLRLFDATVHLVPAETGYRAESGLADYERAHIPGAAFLDQRKALSDLSSGLGFTVPAVDALQAALRTAGINNDSRVVVYSSGHMMWATRAWWLCHYAGVTQVAVLNGGFAAWQAGGYATTSERTSYAAGNFAGTARPGCFVSQGGVLEAIGSDAVCTVNALAPAVYSGEAKMSYGRKGHITGSINLPYDTLLRDGEFLPGDQLKAALDAGGLLGAQQVYAYCGGGISATIDAFACKLLGKDAVAVYDGSMSEWARDESLPLTEGSAPA